MASISTLPPEAMQAGIRREQQLRQEQLDSLEMRRLRTEIKAGEAHIKTHLLKIAFAISLLVLLTGALWWEGILPWPEHFYYTYLQVWTLRPEVRQMEAGFLAGIAVTFAASHARHAFIHLMGVHKLKVRLIKTQRIYDQ